MPFGLTRSGPPRWRYVVRIEGRTRAALPIVFTVIFTRAARAELIDAQDWYEREPPDSGGISEKRLTP
jgi:hypothetical protein